MSFLGGYEENVVRFGRSPVVDVAGLLFRLKSKLLAVERASPFNPAAPSPTPPSKAGRLNSSFSVCAVFKVCAL